MTEDLKFIVAEINNILKTDYNLISFDSLSIENLLQVLLDVLEKFGATAKFEVKDSDPADTNKYILDSLKKIQYRPSNTNDDPTAFRRLLLQGDKKTIYPILQFLFKNAEKVKSLAYLARPALTI
ncbi:Intraflagellar transport protein 81 like [Pseudolycoriella hygida]|uniref:Intraflagellar transport protein 81 like n=1 Tax=Pseudolycoriella hygida TaxID=35572 RepID=A0A9Q0MSF5_9DIPT|nr:Intraflagellar transport protein 81 like [Pseudolycoriella hygida]